MIGVVISAGIFALVRYFARPPPRTMTKEWQEATNEYLRVREQHNCFHVRLVTNVTRAKTPSPSLVSAAKDTLERVRSKADLPLRSDVPHVDGERKSCAIARLRRDGSQHVDPRR